jgi:hypothetical protein
MTTGVLARAALTASIYKRGVRLTGKARTTMTNSDILNHVSTDVRGRPLTAVHSLTLTLQVSRMDACAQWFVRLRCWNVAVPWLIVFAPMLIARR